MIDPILKIVADNPALFAALKKLLVDEFMAFTPLIEMSKTNEELGELVRAKLQGVEKINEAFKKISQIKTTEEIPLKVNRAR
jgi:hypothetical protein